MPHRTGHSSDDDVSARWGLVVLFVIGMLGIGGVGRAEEEGIPPLEYYRVVAERNLFYPLGWTPPDPRPQYTLLLTAVARPSESSASAEANFWAGILGEPSSGPNPANNDGRANRALLARNGSPETFYVEVGDTVGDLTVTSVEERRITLRRANGEEVELSLQEMSFGSGGQPSGGPPRGGEGPSARRPTGGGRGPGGPPPEWRARMAERFRNMSPEQREQMRQQFRRRAER